MRLPYPRCQRFFLRGFRFRSSLCSNPRGFYSWPPRSWLRPADDTKASSRTRKKTSGTEGNVRRHSKKHSVTLIIPCYDCCVLPVYSFSSMSQHPMRRISLMHTTKISSSLLGLIGFYTICPGKNDKFNDAHNSSLSHHCGVHIKIKQKRKQSTFRDATTGFPAKWRLRNERWNSILPTTYLGSASDWLNWIKFPTRHDQSEALPRSG